MIGIFSKNVRVINGTSSDRDVSPKEYIIWPNLKRNISRSNKRTSRTALRMKSNNSNSNNQPNPPVQKNVSNS